MIIPTKNNGTYICGDLTLRATAYGKDGLIKATIVRGDEVVDVSLVGTMSQAVKKLRRAANRSHEPN